MLFRAHLAWPTGQDAIAHAWRQSWHPHYNAVVTSPSNPKKVYGTENEAQQVRLVKTCMTTVNNEGRRFCFCHRAVFSPLAASNDAAMY